MITDREAEDEESRREISFMNYFLSLSLSVCLSFSKSLDGEIMRDWAKIGVNVSRYRLLLSEFFFSSFIISRENIIGILMKRKKRCSNRISFSLIFLLFYFSFCFIDNY